MTGVKIRSRIGAHLRRIYTVSRVSENSGAAGLIVNVNNSGVALGRAHTSAEFLLLNTVIPFVRSRCKVRQSSLKRS